MSIIKLTLLQKIHTLSSIEQAISEDESTTTSNENIKLEILLNFVNILTLDLNNNDDDYPQDNILEHIDNIYTLIKEQKIEESLKYISIVCFDQKLVDNLISPINIKQIQILKVDNLISPINIKQIQILKKISKIIASRTLSMAMYGDTLPRIIFTTTILHNLYEILESISIAQRKKVVYIGPNYTLNQKENNIN